MAVGIEDFGHPMLGQDLTKDTQVAFEALLGVKGEAEHLTGRIVDGTMKVESGPSVFEPIKGTGIDFEEHAFLLHGWPGTMFLGDGHGRRKAA